jgi:hypothetical protein
MLAGQSGIKATRHQLLAGTGDGVGTGVQCLGDLAVTPGITGFRCVCLQQDARLQELAGRSFTLLDQCVESVPLLGSERDDVFLDAGLFRGHGASPGLQETSIQKSAAESTTGPLGSPR